jgi:sulfotransferase
MTAPDADLPPLYRAAPHVSFHHGQIWAGTPPEFFAAVETSFDFRPDDVWLISYPRSGTAWSHEVISAVLYRGDIPALQAAQAQGRVAKFLPLEIGIRGAEALPDRLQAWKALPSPRVIPTHMPPALFPKTALRPGIKRIYIVRDPRDVAVSLFHLHRAHKLLGCYDGTWDDFFECFVAGRVTYGSWFDHTLAWWAACQAAPQDALVLSYERMKRDFAGGVERLAAHLNRTLGGEAVAAIARHTSFDSMRQNPFTNRAGNPVMDFSIAPFIRKGIVGDWTSHFTAAQCERFEALCRQKLAGSGIDGFLFA